MGIDRLYAFEHAKTRTLVRVFGPFTLQVIREGRVVATAQSSDEISLAHNGLLAWREFVTYEGTQLRTFDLGADFPQESVGRGEGQVLAPDGARVLAFREKKLVVRELRDESWRTLFDSDTRRARIVDPLRVGRPAGERSELAPLEWNVQIVATDDERWALLAVTEQKGAWLARIELGRGDRRTASIAWDEAFDWQPFRWTLDAGRLLLSGAHGVTAIALDDGSVVAAWSSSRAVTSPPCRVGDELLVVVEEPGRGWGEPGEYSVMRLDAASLAERGPLEAMGRRRDDEPEQALVALSDGGVAWFSKKQKLRVLGSTLAPSSLIEHAGAARVASVPAPDAAWYDAAIGAHGTSDDPTKISGNARRSLARWLLDELVDANRLEQLLVIDPEAFAPYADAVLSWDDARLAVLASMGRDWWWQLGRGASDAAVDAFSARVAARIELAPLLLGIDTDHALARARALRRTRPELTAVMRELLVEPSTGERRYDPSRRELVTGRGASDGVATMTPPEKVLDDPTGMICAQPLNVLLSVDVSLVGLKSPLRRQHFLLTSCEECDEWSVDYTLARAGKKTALVGRRKKRRCPGTGFAAKRPIAAKLVTRRAPWTKGWLGFVGGRPRWMQGAEPPTCPRCRRLMFFVGQLYASRLRDDVVDNGLYGFHCERCGVARQVGQCT